MPETTAGGWLGAPVRVRLRSVRDGRQTVALLPLTFARQFRNVVANGKRQLRQTTTLFVRTNLTMRNTIIAIFSIILIVSFLVLVVAGGIIGRMFIHENGFLFGAIGAFAASSILFGPAFLLLNINDNVAAIRQHIEDGELDA